jgi:hypothetical protein
MQDLDFEFSGEAINMAKQQQEQIAMANAGGGMNGEGMPQEGMPPGGVEGDNLPANVPRELNPKSGAEEGAFKE